MSKDTRLTVIIVVVFVIAVIAAVFWATRPTQTAPEDWDVTYPKPTVITYECAANAVKFLRDEKPGTVVLCTNGTDTAYIQKEITARSSR